MSHWGEGAVRQPLQVCQNGAPGSLSLFSTMDPLLASFLYQAGPPPAPLPSPSSWSCLFSQISCAQSFLKDGCTGGFVCRLSTLTPSFSTCTASASGHGEGGGVRQKNKCPQVYTTKRPHSRSRRESHYPKRTPHPHPVQCFIS